MFNSDRKEMETVMLNENLNIDQSPSVTIHDRSPPVADTGIADKASANLGARRLARQRFQRMRRRNQRASFARGGATGWVARMAG